jgi:hypothetical protein
MAPTSNGTSLVLPPASANRVLGWNSDADAIVNIDTLVTVLPIADTVHAATNKATPVGADELGIWDSVSGLLNRLSFTNLVAYLSALCSAGWNAATATTATTATTLAATAGEKLPSLNVVQAAGALTFSSAAQYRDFRSATLTTGSPTTLYTAPTDTVLPSGGTLGFTTLIEGTILIAEMNFGGVKEHAICNKAGGLQTDESNLISTTAIGTGSDSVNVWYSTTARTDLPYRIIGEINVTNTAGAWGDATKIQPAGGRALAYQMILATAQATTSGTSIDFTGIPSWAKRITIQMDEISTNGTTDKIIQLGDSGGVKVTGYKSTGTYFIASGNGIVQSTIGMLIGKTDSSGATVNATGHMILTNISGSTWVASFVGEGDYPMILSGSGRVTLTGTLDRIRLTTANGTDTFDAGSVNIMYEG